MLQHVRGLTASRRQDPASFPLYAAPVYADLAIICTTTGRTHGSTCSRAPRYDEGKGSERVGGVHAVWASCVVMGLEVQGLVVL